MRDKYLKYILLLPALIVIAATSFYPFIQSFWISLHNWNLMNSLTMGPFIGLSNYVQAFHDSGFWNSVKVTLIFTGLTVVLSLTISMAIALLLSKNKPYLSVIRGLLIIPFAMSPALIGFSWRFMLNPEYGLFSKLLGAVFPPLANVQWLGQPTYAMVALVSVILWMWIPFISLTLVSGRMSLPGDVFEAARVDGASPFQTFIHITLPLLRPIILIAVILQTMFALKAFDPVVTLTQGGPGVSTSILNYSVYQTAFQFFNMGYASALGYLLAVILVILAAFYMRLLVKGEGWR